MTDEPSGSLPDPATEVVYGRESQLSADEFINVLVRSTLAERRPIHDRKRIQLMLDHAAILVTARANDKLVGIARALSDFAFCTYLSDLAVDRDWQGQGIGKRLIDLCHAAGGAETTLILVAAPAARSYYPHIGMAAHDSCWIIPPHAVLSSRTPPDES